MLKTLKDLDKMKSNLGDFSRDEDLKAEAVKWHKSFNDINQIQVWEFIERFFNLNKEDLKEEGKA